MGALKDKANQQSKFLIIEKGSSVIVRFLDFRFVPSQRDPSVEVVQYKVVEDGKDKFWTNGSGAIMRVMDEIKKGSYVKISRDKWMSKDGREDTSKSSYKVEPCDELGQVLESAPVEKEAKAWDE